MTNPLSLAKEEAFRLDGTILSYIATSDDFAYVAVNLHTNDYTPFVTWMFNAKDGAFHHGNYYQDKELALRNVVDRASLVL